MKKLISCVQGILATKLLAIVSKIYFVTFIFMLCSLPAVAQEMTKDQWLSDMTTYRGRLTSLETQVKGLTDEIASLKSRSSTLDTDLKACQDALNALLGVTNADFDAFEKELSGMEKRVTELQGMSDAALMTYKDEIEHIDNRLKEMAAGKFALIPRYGDRIRSLQDGVAALMKSVHREKFYTVGSWSKDRDCLWNIAKKKDIYANPFLWPKIWQGNREKIKDPDLIKPKWVLKIPEGSELSKEEKSAARSHYRKKAAAPASE